MRGKVLTRVAGHRVPRDVEVFEVEVDIRGAKRARGKRSGRIGLGRGRETRANRPRRNECDRDDIRGLAAGRSCNDRVAISEGVGIRVAVGVAHMATIEVHRLLGVGVQVDDRVGAGGIDPDRPTLFLRLTRRRRLGSVLLNGIRTTENLVRGGRDILGPLCGRLLFVRSLLLFPPPEIEAEDESEEEDRTDYCTCDSTFADPSGRA